MTIWGNMFGAGNGGDQDIDMEHLTLPPKSRARHYADEANKANKGEPNGQGPRDGKII